MGSPAARPRTPPTMEPQTRHFTVHSRVIPEAYMDVQRVSFQRFLNTGLMELFRPYRDIRIDDGDAYTCDLSLEGPAADIGIVGRAGLADRDYDQTALVSANVGNTLPVVGAVVAGPQVAAALLIFSQIFKKPLQEVGQIYYRIDGSFDDPSVEVADARRFAETSELAGCLAATQ